jgi:hypothetical protein
MGIILWPYFKIDVLMQEDVVNHSMSPFQNNCTNAGGCSESFYESFSK